MARGVVEKWEVGVETLCKFSAYLPEAKFHFLSCEISANAVSHDAEKTLNIISTAGSGVFWLSFIDNVVSSLPLTSLYVGDYGHQGLFRESENTAETPAQKIKPHMFYRSKTLHIQTRPDLPVDFK